MKYLFLLLFSLSTTLVNAQTLGLDAFFIKYRHTPNTIAFAVPGWLVQLGLSVSGEAAEYRKIYKPLAKGLGHIRVMVMEDENRSKPKELNNLVKHAKNCNFQELLSVKDGSSMVKIMLREKVLKRKTIIKNVMLLVAEEDGLVLLTLNGRWKKEVLTKLLQENGSNFESIVGVL